MSREEIKEEYLKKLKLYKGLVGRLYPPIVYAELMQLVEAYGWPNDLPPVVPPNNWGYVNG